MKLSRNGVLRCYQTANSLCHYVSRLVGARQVEKPAGAGGRDREGPLQVMGERERVRARSFGPLEKARAFRMTPGLSLIFVRQKKALHLARAVN